MWNGITRFACAARRSGAVIAGLAAFLAQDAGAQANENPLYLAPRGPIPIRNMRPYNLLFLQFLPDSGDALARRKKPLSPAAGRGE